MRIGVLALQGDYEAHSKVLLQLGHEVQPVKTVPELESVEGLIIPGGESTVMARLSERYGLWEPLERRISEGLPVFGTCAGMIFMAKNITGGAQTFHQKTLGVLDMDVARNAYGAQLDSFEADVPVPSLGGTVRAVFIRAPRMIRLGADIEVLATWEEAPVLVRQGNLMATSFHPEIAGESRLHQLWIDGFAKTQVSG